MSRTLAACCALGASIVAVSSLMAQTVVHGHAGAGRAEHCILDSGTRACASGTVLAAGLRAQFGERFEVWGEVAGASLHGAAAPSFEDHDLAQVQLLASVRVQPWLFLRAGPVLRGYADAVSRQHWTTMRLGAEAHVPLALEQLRGVIQAYWIPIANASGLPKPQTALAAGAGLEWRSNRITLSMRYSFERYDFPGATATRRLEELSSLQLRAGIRCFSL